MPVLYYLGSDKSVTYEVGSIEFGLDLVKYGVYEIPNEHLDTVLSLPSTVWKSLNAIKKKYLGTEIITISWTWVDPSDFKTKYINEYTLLPGNTYEFHEAEDRYIDTLAAFETLSRLTIKTSLKFNEDNVDERRIRYIIYRLDELIEESINSEIIVRSSQTEWWNEYKKIVNSYDFSVEYPEVTSPWTPSINDNTTLLEYHQAIAYGYPDASGVLPDPSHLIYNTTTLNIDVNRTNNFKQWLINHEFDFRSWEILYKIYDELKFMYEGIIQVWLDQPEILKQLFDQNEYVKDNLYKLGAVRNNDGGFEYTTDSFYFLRTHAEATDSLLNMYYKYFGLAYYSVDKIWETIQELMFLINGLKKHDVRNRITMIERKHDINPPKFIPSVDSGNDDLTYLGGWKGSEDSIVVIKITQDSSGIPNRFRYRIKYKSTWYEEQDITGEEQTLAYGLKIKFGSTTGHKINDSWEIQTKSGLRWREEVFFPFHNKARLDELTMGSMFKF